MVGQFPPQIGGVGIHIHSLAKELKKRGDEVYVITYPNKNNHDIDGIHVISTTKAPQIPGLRAIFFTISGTHQLIKLARKENIDIIHGHYLIPAGLIAVIAGKITKTTTYVTSHGSDILCVYKKNKILRPLIQYILRNANHILAVSHALKNEILKINIPQLEEKLDINWNIVDTKKFQPNTPNNTRKELQIPTDEKVILFVGNLIPRKKVKYLLKAKQELKTKATLLIVGNGPEYNKLQEYTQENKIQNVIFTGARSDIEKIIPACDLLVLPSVSESFGLVLIEALACGKPVIGSNVEGIKEIITPEVGKLVKERNSTQLAQAIDEILNNPQLYNKLASNARKRAEEFSQIKIPY